MSAVLQDAPEVQAAYGEYRRFTADPVMREKAKARERYWTDRELDRAEGWEEGREEGLEEGEAKKAIAVARNLKHLGVPVATIAKGTGLSQSEVEQLN